MKPPPATRERILYALESLGLHHVKMIGCRHYTFAHPPLMPHRHPGIFEILVLAKGYQSYQVDKKIHRLKGGDVFVTQPGQIHGTAFNAEDKGRLYWMELRRVKPRGVLPGLSVSQSREVMGRLAAIAPQPFAGGEALIPIFDQMIKACALPSSGLRAARLTSLFLQLILDLLELVDAAPRKKVKRSIQAALHLIENRLVSPPSTESLAKSAGVSLSTFNAVFKQATGVPPAEYISRRRVEEAGELLRTTQRSVTEVAHALGFESSQHFATVFKRFTGVSPMLFRRQRPEHIFMPTVLSGAGIGFHPAAPLD